MDADLLVGRGIHHCQLQAIQSHSHTVVFAVLSHVNPIRVLNNRQTNSMAKHSFAHGCSSLWESSGHPHQLGCQSSLQGLLRALHDQEPSYSQCSTGKTANTSYCSAMQLQGPDLFRDRHWLQRVSFEQAGVAHLVHSCCCLTLPVYL